MTNVVSAGGCMMRSDFRIRILLIPLLVMMVEAEKTYFHFPGTDPIILKEARFCIHASAMHTDVILSPTNLNDEAQGNATGW